MITYDLIFYYIIKTYLSTINMVRDLSLWLDVLLPCGQLFDWYSFSVKNAPE